MTWPRIWNMTVRDRVPLGLGHRERKETSIMSQHRIVQGHKEELLRLPQWCHPSRGGYDDQSIAIRGC